jgi:hypothetical protein
MKMKLFSVILRLSLKKIRQSPYSIFLKLFSVLVLKGVDFSAGKYYILIIREEENFLSQNQNSGGFIRTVKIIWRT